MITITVTGRYAASPEEKSCNAQGALLHAFDQRRLSSPIVAKLDGAELSMRASLNISQEAQLLEEQARSPVDHVTIKANRGPFLTGIV